MYLLYVDSEFISSADIKEMVEQSTDHTDIINCFSTSTLLKLAERLSPEIIIIDFELVKDRLSELFSDLREKSEHSYVMALINPDNYEKLYKAIEAGAVDDYIVKPIHKEEFLARVRIAAQKNKREGLSPGAPGSGVIGGGALLDFEHHKSKPQEEQVEPEDQAGLEEQVEPEDQADLEDHAEPEDSFLDSEDTGDSLLGDEPSLEDELEVEDPQFEQTPEEEPVEEHDFTAKDLLDDQKEETEESYDFDDIMPEESMEEPAENLIEPSLEPGPEMDPEEEAGFELFDDFPEPEKTEMVESEEDTKLDDESPEELELDSEPTEADQLFEEESEGPLFEEITEEKADLPEMFTEDDFTEPAEAEGKVLESDEDVKDLDDLFKEEKKEDFTGEPWDMPSEDQDFRSEADQSGATSVKPSADFLDDVTLKTPAAEEPAFTQGPQTEREEFTMEEFEIEEFEKEEPSFDPDFDDDDLSFDQGPVAEDWADEDDKLFDELFEEAPTEPDQPVSFDEPEATPAEPAGRKSLREISELPGETADDFLFGDSSAADEEFEKEMLDELIEEGTYGTRKKKKQDRGKEKKSSGGFSKFFSILGNVIFVLLLLMMATLSFFLIQSRIAGGVPEVAGYQMYIVLSGSMSPEFDTGSLAFVREVDTDELTVGDIITYRTQADSDSLTTHRIVEVQRNDSLQFVTRGDANNVNDPRPVLAENIVGQVTGSVPYVGYVLNFVQTRQGLILLIFVPGVLIIIYELGKIMKYLTQGSKGTDKKEKDGGGDTRFAEH